MEHFEDDHRCKVTTAENQQFTSIGPFLRRWKLDELPQLFNVLVGNMSLVGPRPKLAEHQLGELKSRPGITGAATIAFAREELILARLPDHHLDNVYHSVILPAKFRLDREYAARATFASDLKLILDTILRRWDSEAIFRTLAIDPIERPSNFLKNRAPLSVTIGDGLAEIAGDESMASGD